MIKQGGIADANETRDWRIYSDFAQILIHEARQLYADDDFGLELKDSKKVGICIMILEDWQL